MYVHDGKCYMCQNSFNDADYDKIQKVVRMSLENDSFQFDICKVHLEYALSLF
jgi:tRNA U54 and U55 pseudouridine synthase Pus10